MTIATATPGANRVPKANGVGKLAAGWLTAAALLSDLGLGSGAAGDLIYGTGANTLGRLSIPTAGQILTSTGTAPAWSGSGLTYASGVFQVAGSVPGMPSAGQVLIGGGAVRPNVVIGRGNDQSFIQSRNAANNATLDIMYLDGTNRLVLGSATTPIYTSGTITSAGDIYAGGTDAQHRVQVNGISTGTGAGSMFTALAGGSAGLYFGHYSAILGGGANLRGVLYVSSDHLYTYVGGTQIVDATATAMSVSGSIGCTTLTTSGDMVVNSPALTSARLILNRGGTGQQSGVYLTDATGTKYNWFVGAQNYVNDAFEIDQSTTVGGSTYSTVRFSINASGVCSILGSAPGTPGATEVLIGGGQVYTGAGITCTTLTATTSGILSDHAGATNPAFRQGSNANVSFIEFNTYYSGSVKRSRAGGSAGITCDYVNAYTYGHGSMLFQVAGNGLIDSVVSMSTPLILSAAAPGTPGASDVLIGGGQIRAGAGITAGGLIQTTASATGGAGLNLPHGTAPTSPVNGDIWTTTAGAYARINNATINLGSGSPGGSDTQLQFNNSGSFGGSANLTWSGSALSVNAADAATNTSPDVLVVGHTTSATPLPSFGGTIRVNAHSTTNTVRSVGSISAKWVSATDASRRSRVILNASDASSSDVECMRFESGGSGVPYMGFFGATSISRPTVSGSRGGNAALASFLTQMASLGLITDTTTA